MIKRTIDISEGPTHLSIENDQLILTRARERIGQVPCEDIGMLLVDHIATTYTHSVFTRLLKLGGVVVLCGDDHLPRGMLVSMESNDLTAERLRIQAAAPLPLRKRLWRQIVRHKVRGQARNLPLNNPVRRRLLAMADEVKSGDGSNIEGQSARFYWPALMGEDFRRDTEGPPPNDLLNYGYMVMRAAVARAIATAGLHPAFALHHSNRRNTFALADDLVETLRPMVDAAVVELTRDGVELIDRPAKQKLLTLLTREVRVGDQSGPLMVQLHRVATSLLRCYERTEKKLNLPEYPLDPSQPSATKPDRDQPDAELT